MACSQPVIVTFCHAYCHPSLHYPGHPCSLSLIAVGVFAYVILKAGVVDTPELQTELRQRVRAELGAFAAPDHILVPTAPLALSYSSRDLFIS